MKDRKAVKTSATWGARDTKERQVPLLSAICYFLRALGENDLLLIITTGNGLSLCAGSPDS